MIRHLLEVAARLPRPRPESSRPIVHDVLRRPEGCGIAADAVAQSANVTAPDPQQSGFLTIWLRDKTRPIANSINFVPGKVPANCTFIVVSASEARADLLRLVDAAQRGDRAIVAKRAGGRIARIEEFEALRASARLWQDPAALHAMRGSSDDLRRGRMTTVRSPLSPKQLGARGRA